MATEERDFKVKRGIVVGGNVSAGGGSLFFDASANTVSINDDQVIVQSKLDEVQSNVYSNEANIYSTYITLSANDHATYTLLNENIDTVQSNLTSTEQELTANIYNTYVTLTSDIDTVSTNVESLDSTLTANIYNTYVTLTSDIDTVSSNVESLDAELTANIYNTYVTLNSDIEDNTGRLDSLRYFNSISANGSITATSNADTLTISAGDGISLLSDEGSRTLTIAVDGSSDVDSVQDNVNIVSANVDAVVEGSTPFTGSITFEQDVSVVGDLYVGGNTSYISSTDTVLTDRVLILANGTSTASFDSGLLVVRGSSANVFIGFDEGSDEYVAAYTADPGDNGISNYSFSAYANAHFDNITVEGLVDGVDVAALSSNVLTAQSDIIDNTGRLDSLRYFRTVSVGGTDVVADANADSISIVADSGIIVSANADTDTITISSSIGGDVDSVSDNVESVSSNLISLSSEVGTISSNVNTNTSGLGTLTDNVIALSANVDVVNSNVNTVNSNLEAVVDGSTAFTGEVTFNEPINAPVVQVNSQLHTSANVASGVGSDQTTLFSFPGSTYRGAELTLLTQDIINSEYQVDKMLLVHDGTDVFFVEYGTVFTGNTELTTFNVTIDGSDIISVSSSGGSANKKISVASHKLIQ